MLLYILKTHFFKKKKQQNIHDSVLSAPPAPHVYFYLGQVGGTPDGPPQSFTVWVYSSHMAPHPLPSLLIHREASSVDIERHPSIPQLFLSFILLLLVSLLHGAGGGAQHPLLLEPDPVRRAQPPPLGPLYLK